MNVFKRKSTKVIGIIVAVGLAFTSGISASADNGWLNNLLFDKGRKLHEKGASKVEEIRNNSTKGIEEVIGARVDDIIAEKEQSIDRELEAYYMSKVEGMAESEFNVVETKIDEIEAAVLTKYKKEIDAILAE